MLKPASFWGSVILLTALGYLVFPGHTYLQADTQIYVPMMERDYDPVLFSGDPMISRPHLALTAYDEIATVLRNYAGMDFEIGLKFQQVLFRACMAAGLLLIALRLGLEPPGAFLAAALVILNVGGLGMGITEREPVARSFALGLVIFGVGLAIEERFWAAGIFAALGFLMHPTTTAPFWGVAVFAVLRRAARPIILAPLLPAAGLLLILMHFQSGTTEPVELFRRLDPFQEALQRRLMSFNFVSEWETKMVLDCWFECGVVAVGFWRLRYRLKSPLLEWLGGLAVLSVLSIPFSIIVMDQLHWAMAGPWTPTRALVFITLLAALFSGVCGIIAAQQRRWWEAPLWFAIALALPVKEYLATWFVNAWLLVLVFALVGAYVAAGRFAERTLGITLIAGGVLPFIAFAASGLIPFPKSVDTPELKQLAEWALSKTDETAVFLFADDGRYGGSGPFRARALRSIYVDYEGRALVNFYPQFSVEWAQRWRDVHEGVWLVGPQDFPDLAERHVDFVVLRAEHAIPAKRAEFSNSQYVVYQVLPGF